MEIGNISSVAALTLSRLAGGKIEFESHSMAFIAVNCHLYKKSNSKTLESLKKKRIDNEIRSSDVIDNGQSLGT